MFFPDLPLYSKTEIVILGQLDMVRHPAEVGIVLLLAVLIATVLIATLIAPVAADIALVHLMTAHDIGIAELEFGEHLPPSLPRCH